MPFIYRTPPAGMKYMAVKNIDYTGKTSVIEKMNVELLSDDKYSI